MRWFILLVLVSVNAALASRMKEAKGIKSTSTLGDEDSVIRLRKLIKKSVSKAEGLSEADIKAFLKGSNYTVPNIDEFITRVQRRARRQRMLWRGRLAAAAFYAPISFRNVMMNENVQTARKGDHKKHRFQSLGAESHTGRLHIEAPALKQQIPPPEESLKEAPAEATNEEGPKAKQHKKNDGAISIAVRARQSQRSNKRRRHVNRRGHIGNAQRENAVYFGTSRAGFEPWGYSTFRADQPSAVAEALAILTQKMSKLDLQLVRLKEVVLLQGAVHIRTSERMENMLNAQHKLALRNDAMSLEMFDRLERCCTCSSKDDKTTQLQTGEAGTSLNGQWSAEQTDSSEGRGEDDWSEGETIDTDDEDPDESDKDDSDNIIPLTDSDHTTISTTQMTYQEKEIHHQNDRHSTSNDRIKAERTSPATSENGQQPEQRKDTQHAAAQPSATAHPHIKEENDLDHHRTTRKYPWLEPWTQRNTRFYEMTETIGGARDQTPTTTPHFLEAPHVTSYTRMTDRTTTTPTTSTTTTPTTTTPTTSTTTTPTTTTTTPRTHHFSPRVQFTEAVRLPSSNGSLTVQGESDHTKTQTVPTTLPVTDIVTTSTAGTTTAKEIVKLLGTTWTPHPTTWTPHPTTWTPHPTTPKKDNLTVDLSTGRIENDDLPGVSWVVPPAMPDRPGSSRRRTRSSDTTVSPDDQCAMQGVLRFTFTPPESRIRRQAERRSRRLRRESLSMGEDASEDGHRGDAERPRRKLLVEMTFKTPTQWVFNLGDSIANNGFSGDGSVQENDCEVQGYGTTFAAYGSDKHHNWRQKLLRVINSFIYEKVTLVVSDETLSWDNHRGIADSMTHPSLFALSGQSDSQGKINYDVFLGLNRVIEGNYRTGRGLCLLTARWLEH